MKTNNIQELKKMNCEFKNQIRMALLKIGNLIKKKNALEKLKININLDKELHYLENNLILNDLPLKQQISIYQESNSLLKKKISKIEEESKFIFYNNNKVEIFNLSHLNNEIKKKREILYNLNKENEILEKVKKNNDENYNYLLLNNEEGIIIKKFKEEINIKKQELKLKRIEEKEGEKTLKKINKDINNLEKNITLIKDNIDYKRELNKKNMSAENIKKNNENEIESQKEKLKELELNYNNDKNLYYNLIKNQKNKINSLVHLIQFLEDKYREIINLERLNKMKQIDKIRKIQIKQNEKIHKINLQKKEKFYIFPIIRTSFSQKKSRSKNLNMKIEKLKTNNSYILPKINNSNFTKSRKLNINKNKNETEENICKIPNTFIRSKTPINKIRKVFN